jgi:hypothetical protein
VFRSAREVLRGAFPWPLIDTGGRWGSAAATVSFLAGALASRLALLPDGPWEQDEALLACGVLDFDPLAHMPVPPGFPLWIYIGRAVRLLGVADPLIALQAASAALSVVGLWALIGLWEPVAGRRAALTGALLAAFLPGVWFHSHRGFSETPSAALAVVALALWVRGGRRAFASGLVAMTAAALIRPPLLPFCLAAGLLAAWAARSRPARLAGGALAAAGLAAAVSVPAVLEAGGAHMFYDALRGHAAEHFNLLGSEGWSVARLGFVRGLGPAPAGAAFVALALFGWWTWRRTLGWRWAAGSIAGVALAATILLTHNTAHPRYWVLVWLLLATPAVAGACRLTRSEALGGAASAAAALASALWTWPAMRAIAAGPIPPVAALRAVAAQPGQEGAALVFEDQLFSFRNLAVRQGWLRVPSDTTRGAFSTPVRLGGVPVWLLSEAHARDVDCLISQVREFSAPGERLERLSQGRFLRARLVREPLIAWRGGFVPEYEGGQRFTWLSGEASLLVPPREGAGRLVLAIEAPADVGIAARLDGVDAPVVRVPPGRQLLTIPLPPPDGAGGGFMSVLELRADREVTSREDLRSLGVRIFNSSFEAGPTAPRPFEFFPGANEAFAAVARVGGFHAEEVLPGPPARWVAWTGARARVEMAAGPGSIGFEMVAPRPEPARVELRIGDSAVTFDVGARPRYAEIPVPEPAARERRALVEIASTAFAPGGHDQRVLGVAVARVWYRPAGVAPVVLADHGPGR